MKVLVTGAAGFIGFHTAKRLLEHDAEVIGLDSFNDYYDPTLKEARAAMLTSHDQFRLVRGSITEKGLVAYLFDAYRPNMVVHLAAQAGVRYSIESPRTYADINLSGFLEILECCRNFHVEHLVYASSSSVYGASAKVPFSVSDNVDHPISLYAATKKANELMAHTYSHLFKLPTTGLRFFTAYGPWGRPDMAYFKFTEKILRGEPIQVFNHGDMSRDFTYVDDIVWGVTEVLKRPPSSVVSEAAPTGAPYRIYNIGARNPVRLMDMIETLERLLGQTAVKEMLPMQPGDVPATYADVSDLEALVGFDPKVDLETGLSRFTSWYCDYFKVSKAA